MHVDNPDRTEPRSLYVPVDCEIVSVEELTRNEKLFRLRPADGSPLGHLPGQFVQVSLLGWGEAPISVASSPTRDGFFDLGVRRVGSLTGELHRLAAGDMVGIRGPFGRPFELPRLRGMDLLLVSGGCGLAPMRSLIQYCQDRREEFGRIAILHGAKSPAETMFRQDLDEWAASGRFTCSRTVDRTEGDGCYDGNVGLVTSLLAPLEVDAARTAAVIVGPPVMYRPVIAELARKGIGSGSIMISLERQMRCGVGKCGHCTIEHLYCCQDGPVFRVSEVERLRGAL